MYVYTHVWVQYIFRESDYAVSMLARYAVALASTCLHLTGKLLALSPHKNHINWSSVQL